MNDFPMTYAMQEYFAEFNMQPSTVKGRINDANLFYRRQNYNDLYSAFKFDLSAAGWTLGWFRFWVFHYGSVAAVYTKKFGWILHPYSILEYDVDYQPKKISVHCRFIDNDIIGIVGLNCVIFHAFDDYFGFDDIVQHYAEKLASIDKAVDVNLMNAGIGMVAQAESKKQADEIGEAYGKASTGQPLVIVGKKTLGEDGLQPMIPDIASRYITDKLLIDKRKVRNEFLTAVGIKNANMDKRERLNSQEVEANDDETRALVTVALENLRKGFRDFEEISGISCTVELRYTYEEGGEEDA